MNKTSLCLHDHSCLRNIINKFFRGFCISLLIKIPLSISIQILKKKYPKKQKINSFKDKLLFLCNTSKNLLIGSFNIDTLKFVFYFSIWLGSFPAVLCLLRRYRKNTNQQPLNHGIAGLISGLSLYIDEKGPRRNEAAVYLFSRAICASWKLGVENKILPSIPHGDVWIFCLFTGIIQYTFIFEPEIMRKQFYQFIDDLSRDPQGRLDKFLLNLRRQYHIKVPNGHEVVERSACNTDYYYKNQLQLQDTNNYISDAHKPYLSSGDCKYFDDIDD